MQDIFYQVVFIRMYTYRGNINSYSDYNKFLKIYIKFN